MARSYSDDYVICTSGFVNGITFSQKWRQWSRTKHVMFRRVHQVAEPGAKSDCYECLAFGFVLKVAIDR